MKCIMLFVLLIGLVSCGDPLVSEPAGSGFTSPTYVARPLGRMEFDGAEMYQGDSESAKQARLKLLDGVMERYRRIRAIVRANEGGTLDRGDLRKALDSTNLSEGERWFVDQMSATLVLESMAGSPEDTVAAKTLVYWDGEIAGDCLSILLRYRSPNAPLIARVLGRLRGEWTDAEVSEVAAVAARHALEWLERDCVTCTPAVAPVSHGAERLRTGSSRMTEAVDVLIGLSRMR